MEALPDSSVVHNADLSRYEIFVAGELAGFCDAHIHLDDRGEVVTLPRTVVVPAMRGRGVAAALVGAVLDDLQARRARVDPQCWYVAGFIDSHPRYEELRL